MNHVTDFGTSWQTCHAFQQGSAQFAWYSSLMARSPQSFLVTLYNEQNSRVRRLENGAWDRSIRLGSIAIAAPVRAGLDARVFSRIVCRVRKT